jgi:hypothetical protein
MRAAAALVDMDDQLPAGGARQQGTLSLPAVGGAGGVHPVQRHPAFEVKPFTQRLAISEP